MAYQTYTTEALVCGSKPSNTSDSLALLFTRDAGMVFAHVRSIREEKSKHRYSLQPFSHMRVTLVRGKTGWKVTGAEPIRNFYTEATTREERAFWRNTMLLIRRVMQGETPHERVFDDVLLAYKSLKEGEPKKLERVLSLRILHELGYVAPHATLDPLLTPAFPHADIQTLSHKTEKKCMEVIALALSESQL